MWEGANLKQKIPPTILQNLREAEDSHRTPALAVQPGLKIKPGKVLLIPYWSRSLISHFSNLHSPPRKHFILLPPAPQWGLEWLWQTILDRCSSIHQCMLSAGKQAFEQSHNGTASSIKRLISKSYRAPSKPVSFLPHCIATGKAWLLVTTLSHFSGYFQMLPNYSDRLSNLSESKQFTEVKQRMICETPYVFTGCSLCPIWVFLFLSCLWRWL